MNLAMPRYRTLESEIAMRRIQLNHLRERRRHCPKFAAIDAEIGRIANLERALGELEAERLRLKECEA